MGEVHKMYQLDRSIRENMKSLRDGEKLCDFTIVVCGHKFNVHKVVLASCSDYFRCMFDHNSKESKDSEVIINDLTSAAMKSIIDFCYNSELALNNDNVHEILIGAHLLQMKEIENLCVNYMKKRIDHINCLYVLDTADRCSLIELYNSALDYCLDRFMQVIDQKEFLYLDEDKLSRIISHDELNVDSEESVFNAIMLWISHDYNNRSSKVSNLLMHVRIWLLEPIKIKQILSNQLVHNDIGCRDLIDEALLYILFQRTPYERSLFLESKFKPRESLRSKQRIYALGGWTNEFKPINGTERFDPYKDEWTEVSAMTRPRCGVGVAILNGFLYAIGGHDGQVYLKSAERFRIADEVWFNDVADMRGERTSVGVVALNGYIYAIGGQYATVNLDRVEKYDSITNTWTICVPMLEKRLGAGVTVLNGLIYALGGADIDVLDSVECYDSEKNCWNYVASMRNARKHFGCATYDGKIYAVGGRGDSCELDTAERYDPIEDRWEPIASMCQSRSGLSLVELDGLLYAIGGHNGDIRLNLVESYDPKQNKWTIRKPMIRERLGAGVAVYSKLKAIYPN